MPHLLWHGASVYNGHLRGPVTLIPIAERLAVELLLPVLRIRSVAARIRTPNLPLAGQRLKPLRYRRGHFEDLSYSYFVFWIFSFYDKWPQSQQQKTSEPKDKGRRYSGK